MINWQTKHYDELTKEELYAILQLRSEVFIVEQNCVYLDLDRKDFDCWHILGKDDDRLVAYMRVIPVGIESDTEGSIGRIVIDKAYRGKGFGHELVNRGLALYEDKVGKRHPIIIHAQSQLESFYAQHGFKTISEPYMFEGLLHTNMILSTPS